VLGRFPAKKLSIVVASLKESDADAKLKMNEVFLEGYPTMSTRRVDPRRGSPAQRGGVSKIGAGTNASDAARGKSETGFTAGSGAPQQRHASNNNKSLKGGGSVTRKKKANTLVPGTMESTIRRGQGPRPGRGAKPSGRKHN